MYTGERQAGRIRAKYLHAILRQDVGYFDTKSGNTAAIVASVSSDTLLIQDAISEKVSLRNPEVGGNHLVLRCKHSFVADLHYP